MWGSLEASDRTGHGRSRFEHTDEGVRRWILAPPGSWLLYSGFVTKSQWPSSLTVCTPQRNWR
jgi:hypothetical protein